MTHRSIHVVRDPAHQRRQAARAGSDTTTSRKAAEWTTLGISLAILVGLTGFLIREGVTPDPPFIPVQTKPLLNQVRQVEGRFVLPVEVTNPGRKIVTNLKVELRAKSGHVEADIDLDYVGRHTTQTVYAILDKDPRQSPVTVMPRIYTLE